MTNKDKLLVDFIIEGTKNGTLRWEPTASEDELLATLRGSHAITIRRFQDFPDRLKLRNSNGQEVLELDGNDDQRINTIYRLAQRNAFDVDKTIDEILGPDRPITDDDIPF